jgi:hypothetical protein
MDGPESAAGFVMASASAVASAEKSGSSPRSVITRRAMTRSSLRFCAEGRLIFGQEYAERADPQNIHVFELIDNAVRARLSVRF